MLRRKEVVVLWRPHSSIITRSESVTVENTCPNRKKQKEKVGRSARKRKTELTVVLLHTHEYMPFCAVCESNSKANFKFLTFI